MTTTEDRPTAEFPSSIDPLRDKPDNCPPWCLGHSIGYAEDLSGVESAEEYDQAKRLFQEHRRYIADRTLWTVVNYTDQDYDRDGVFREGTRVLREGGGSYSIQLYRPASGHEFEGVAELNVMVSSWRQRERNNLPLTSGEARQMAASLIRAADLLDRDAYDTDAVVSQRVEPAAVADEIQAVQR